MALYQKDVDSLSSGADQLAQLILGNQHKSKQIEQEALLKNQAAKEAALLEQQAEQDAIDANVRRAELLAEKQGVPKGRFSVNASRGGFAVNPEPQPDPLNAFLKQGAFQERADRLLDRSVNELSKRVEKADIGASQTALQDLKQSVENKGLALGPISGALPATLVGIGEQLGLARPGATEQRQNIAALQAFQRNPLFGTALSKGEQQSFNDAFGLLAGGSEEQRKQAIKRLESLYNKAVSNITAGFNDDVIKEYRRREGLPLTQIKTFGEPSGLSPEEVQEMEQLRKELGR